MHHGSKVPASNEDILNCEREPIHIIGKIQGHGVLVACNLYTKVITQVSANCHNLFGFSSEELLGHPLKKLIKGSQLHTQISEGKEASFFESEKVEINGNYFLVLPHISQNSIILDFEPLPETTDSFLLQKKLSEVMSSLKSADTVNDLCSKTAGLVREMFAYDRVMLYRFDENWNGEVVAEEKNKEEKSWLGLRYPASDIPKQARQIFFKQQVRIIADSNCNPVPIVPEYSPITDQPLDISKSHLRAVSPIHIEYLKNMEVGASLTAAIIVDNELWGLVACHHETSKFLNYYERQNVKFLVQVLSNEISLRQTNDFLFHTEKAAQLREKIFQFLQKEKNLAHSLYASPVKFTDLLKCSGGAYVIEDEFYLLGQTPSKKDVETLVNEFLKPKNSDFFQTKQLSSVFSKAEKYTGEASGLLALRITQNSFILWFRPEVLQTVTWGGNPENKATYNETEKRLSPRKSFEKWSQELKGTAEAWAKSDFSVAKSFRDNVRSVMLEKQVEKIENLNQELVKANADLELFSYGLGHDLQAPIRGIEGYVQIMKENHSQHLNAEGKEMLGDIAKMVDNTQVLIKDLLSYHRFTSGEIHKTVFSLTNLIEEILVLQNTSTIFSRTKINVDPNLPELFGDRRMLFQAWNNLVGNALKYSAKKQFPEIEIGQKIVKGQKTVYIKDNGIGISEKYLNMIFNAFTRVAGNDFEGSGIGLALAKKIIEEHGGKIWAESEKDEFSIFYVQLPNDK